MSIAMRIDFVIAAVLVIAMFAGAKRGLFKSLMGLLSVVIALVGAAVLTNLLVEPATDLIYPKLEQTVVADLTKRIQEYSSDPAKWKTEQFFGSESSIAEQFERFGIDPSELAQDAAASAGRTVSAFARTAVSSAIRIILFLVLFALLKIALVVVVSLLNRAFDLPILKQANKLGGALLALTETVLIIFLVIYAAPRVGFTWLDDHADGTVLLAWFSRFSPLSLLMTLCSTVKAANI